MKNVFVVLYATEKGNYGKAKAVFVNEEDANRAAKGFGFGEVTDMLYHSNYMKILRNMKRTNRLGISRGKLRKRGLI